eukprot:scaffold5017_cov171-Amphora_coffeaeformis.AAC.17
MALSTTVKAGATAAVTESATNTSPIHNCGSKGLDSPEAGVDDSSVVTTRRVYFRSATPQVEDGADGASACAASCSVPVVVIHMDDVREGADVVETMVGWGSSCVLCCSRDIFVLGRASE